MLKFRVSFSRSFVAIVESEDVAAAEVEDNDDDNDYDHDLHDKRRS